MSEPDPPLTDFEPPVAPDPLPTRTPMFQAIHAARYDRQLLIKEIDKERKAQVGGENEKHLICYVSGRHTHINRDDIVFLVDLLERIPKGSDIDLLLHTPGGDMDAAEKMVVMIRTKVATAAFRVIVPDFAKSAGTLIAIGADKVVMSDSSELGPIDPQIALNDGRGNRIPHSVQAFLDAYDFHSKALQANPNDVTSQLMLNKLDPSTMKLFEAAKDRARNLAQKHLQRGMLRSGLGPKTYTQVALDLLDTKRWLTHGQMIGPDDAKEIGLEVEYLEATNKHWRQYWKVYCLQRLAVGDRQKLFESHYVSLPIDG